jgi:hypothetical protein
MSKVFPDFKKITTQCELRRTLEFMIDRASYRVEVLHCYSNPEFHPLSIDGQHEWSLRHPELECSNSPHTGSSTYKTGAKLSHNFGEITLVTSTV